MAGKLQQEIRQTKPFPGPQEEAILNIARTSDVLDQQLSLVLKEQGLSPAQYNVLRILRGAGPDGLPCGEIGARMIARDPDITRLLDRLERRALVTRRRDESDRRVVTVRITEEGLGLLSQLDAPLKALLDRLMGGMDNRKLAVLIELLEEVRENARQTCAADGTQVAVMNQ